jgi:hypothetical protein
MRSPRAALGDDEDMKAVSTAIAAQAQIVRMIAHSKGRRDINAQ